MGCGGRGGARLRAAPAQSLVIEARDRESRAAAIRAADQTRQDDTHKARLAQRKATGRGASPVAHGGP
eukprot:gene38774-26675_t